MTGILGRVLDSLKLFAGRLAEWWRSLKPAPLLVLLIVISLWSVLVAVGALVSIQDVTASVGTVNQLLKMIQWSGQGSPLTFFTMLLAWTWTNLLALSVLSAIIAQVCKDEKKKANFRIGVGRGFFAYLLVLTGQVIVLGGLSSPLVDVAYREPAGSPPGQSVTAVASVSLDIASIQSRVAQSHYLRLAGTVTLLSFVLSYSPDLFKNLLDSITNRINAGED